MYLHFIGREQSMKKLSEECDVKSREITEMKERLEHLKQSLSSSETNRQVSLIILLLLGQSL